MLLQDWLGISLFVGADERLTLHHLFFFPFSFTYQTVFISTHEFFLSLALWFFPWSCCGGVSEQLSRSLAANWGQPTILFLSLMKMLDPYQSCLWILRRAQKIGFGFSKTKTCDVPIPGTGKAGSARGNMRALKNTTCCSCSVQHLQ